MVHFRLYWQCTSEVGASYAQRLPRNVFLHLCVPVFTIKASPRIGTHDNLDVYSNLVVVRVV